MEESLQKLLRLVVERESLRIGKFVLKSGRASPYFFNAAGLNDGEALSIVGEAYADLIVEKGLACDLIFGPAYKGIPLAAATASALWSKHGKKCRFAYDRKEQKFYGDPRDMTMVGLIKDNDNVVILDDVITTGMTKLDVVDRLKNMKTPLNISAIVVLFDRKEKDESGNNVADVLKNEGIDLHPVLDAVKVFELLRNREINGKVLVTDDAYQAFMEYFDKYGIRA